MGKKKISTTKTSSISSGKRRISRWKKMLRRTNMKIARFKRYKEEGKKTAKKSSRRGWSITGLEKHVALLQGYIKKGPNCKAV